MSFQVQPQAQPQQPVQVYPATTAVTNQQQPPNSHHYSNGNFGAVFIVLAVILVISLLACFVGRLCSRRGRPESHGGGHGHTPFKRQNMVHSENQSHYFRPKDGGDVELGFDKRIPTTKPNGPKFGPEHGHGPNYGRQGSRPNVYSSGGNNGVSSGEEKGYEMKNGGEGSMKVQGHGPKLGLGYGGRGPRPIIFGGGRGNGGGGGEEKGFEMRNGGERSMREQGHNGHDAPYKFTL